MEIKGKGRRKEMGCVRKKRGSRERVSGGRESEWG